MNKEQLKARLAEITQALNNLRAKENMDNTDLEQMEKFATESEGILNKISILEKADKALEGAQASAGRIAEPAPVAATSTASRIQVGASGTDRFGGFKSSAEFLKAVARAGVGEIHPVFQNAAYEKSSEDGGYLVPEDIQTQIVSLMQAEESLLSRTRQYRVSGNSLTLPVDHNQPWASGIQAYWIKEGGQFEKSQQGLDNASWKLKKLGALVPLTEELREDAVAMESYIKENAPKAIVHKINDSIIAGTGAGEMGGILNSPFTITVSKEGSQTGDTVVARNVINMYTRMMPAARGGAVWLIHPEVEAQLMTMKDDNGNFIYLAAGSSMNNQPFGILLGRPVLPMMYGVKQLGDKGDIIFANFDYYYSIVKAGIRSDMSTHIYFERDMAAFRFVQRIDGHCPFKAPVKAQNGTFTASAFVVLEDRT